MESAYLVDGVLKTIAVEEKNGTKGTFVVRHGDMLFEADVRRISETELSFRVAGRSHTVLIARDKDRKIVFLDGREYVLREAGEASGSPRESDVGGPDGGPKIKAPMPGKVIKVMVSVGQDVRKNQTLVIVEAMKMENEIKSAIEGSVRRINVSPGELVDPEKILIELDSKK
jgi:biotin carboxyl carrier protein